MDLLGFLVIGAVAGWIAGELTRDRGFGLLGNMILGVIGAFVGGLLFGALGVDTYGILGSLVTATIGSVILLWVAGMVSSRRTI